MSSIEFKKIVGFTAAGLVLAQFAVFFLTQSRPIYWQQREITFHRFFWSMDGISGSLFNIDPADERLRPPPETDREAFQIWQKREDGAFRLHSGLTGVDFLKPLVAKQSEGDFRLRQFSYLFEMLSSKYWQWMGVVSLRDYTLVGLHLMNCVLIFLILSRLQQNVFSAAAGSLLLLNSGVALATLLFPFRSAKILVVTLFLLAWLILIQNDGQYPRMQLKERLCFWGLCLAGALTDEYAVFLFLLLVVYLVLQGGGKNIGNEKFRRDALTGTVVYLALALGCLKAVQYFDRNLQFSIVQSHFEKFPEYFSTLATFRDTAKAFFQYFLPRNFGYWDYSPWGIAAVISFVGVLIFLCRKNSLGGKLKILLFSILGIILLKALVLPHNSGVHAFIMPEGTVFPSLFFFSYYYVYLEAVLFSLVAGILAAGFVSSPARFAIFLIPLTVMACSGSFHLAKGPREAIAFHNWTPDHERAAESILNIQRFIKSKELRPVYLSFPSGRDNIFKRNVYLFKTEQSLYGSLILTAYLRALERGEAVVSLGNVSAKARVQSRSKLGHAKTFLDVPSGRTIELDKLDESHQRTQWASQRISAATALTHQYRFIDLPSKVLVFILGEADFKLRVKDSIYSGTQSYGFSFQAFEFPLSQENSGQNLDVQLFISPKNPGDTVEIIGPFVICDNEKLCRNSGESGVKR